MVDDQYDNMVERALVTHLEGNCSANVEALQRQGQGRRVKKGAWKKGYDLPPCKVCGSKGAGLHYGVNTCEACKGFFRRSIVRTGTYRCRQNDKCEITAGKRNMCPACRLQRCQDMGMSQEGIKIGRYTTEKCRQDTVAVKQIKAEGTTSRVRGPSQDDEHFQNLVSAICEAARKNMDTLSALHLVVSQIKQLLFLNMERKALNGTIVDPSTPPGDFPQNMQLEPDIRDLMFGTVMTFVDSMVKKFIKFAKAIPGFRAFPLDDQIALVKASFNDVLDINKYKYIDVDGRITMTDGSHFDLRRFFHATSTYHSMQANTKMCARFRSLELRDEEVMVIQAFVLLSTDRCSDLHMHSQIVELQEDVLHSLIWLLKENHPGEPLLIARLAAFLTEIRSVSEIGRKTATGVIQAHVQKQGFESIPAIFWEIL